MISVKYELKRATQVSLTLAAMMAANFALAVGTPSGTSVDNLATIDYSVGGVAQTEIESSPTGNSTPGAGNGTATSFTVDNMVDLTVAEVGGAPTPVNPGQPNAVAIFSVVNTGNTTQDYALSVTNLTGADPDVHGNADTNDVNNMRAFVDGNGNGVYDPLIDTQTFIGSLAPDLPPLAVFVVVDTPIGASDGDYSNVRLTVVTHNAGTSATSATVETAGANTAGVDVVFADGGRDGLETADDGYAFDSADLTITKTSRIVSDPFNGTTNPKAIPGAVLEYDILLSNAGTVSADGILVTDVINANLTLLLGQYGGSDVEIQIGVGPASTIQCTADSGDTDSDGCGITGSTLEVQPAGLSVGTTAADNPVRILFQATVD